MGLGVRSFIFEENGKLRKLPWTRMIRLFQNVPGEHLGEYAGKTVRSVSIWVAFLNRRPSKIIGWEFNLLFFDEQGRLDRTAEDRRYRLTVESAPAALDAFQHRRVVPIAPHLARRAMQEEFRWVPSDDDLRRIRERIWH